MSKTTFTDALARGVLVFDGAMGTEIYRHHVFTNRSFDELCLSDPKLIETIHRDYCEAGADVLTTNTFGASGWAWRNTAWPTRSATSTAPARRSPGGWPTRPIGPCSWPARSAPWPRNGSRKKRSDEMIAEQVAALWEGGADFIIFETQPSRAASSSAPRPCAASPKCRSSSPAWWPARANRSPASRSNTCWPRCPADGPQPIAWGLNCGTGPDGLLSAVERAVRVIALPLVVQPNAGIPREVDHRRIYFCSPEYLTEYAKRFVNLGASCVGGCCGTTPEHIREMSRTIKPLSRRRTEPTVKAGRGRAAEAGGPLGREVAAWQAAGRRASG